MGEYNLMGNIIHAKKTSNGIRGLNTKGEEQDPYRIWKLLNKKFGGDRIGFVIHEMELAASQTTENDDDENNNKNKNLLSETSYRFYMYVRPEIPPGTKGW